MSDGPEILLVVRERRSLRPGGGPGGVRAPTGVGVARDEPGEPISMSSELEPIGEVRGEGGLRIAGGGGGAGGLGGRGIAGGCIGGGGGGTNSLVGLPDGGDGSSLSEGVLGDSLGGEMSPKSVSLTGDMSDWPPVTTSVSATTISSMTTISVPGGGGSSAEGRGGKGGVLGPESCDSSPGGGGFGGVPGLFPFVLASLGGGGGVMGLT